MNFKNFWHRLVSVITLTIYLITIQFSLLANQALADNQNCKVNCKTIEIHDDSVVIVHPVFINNADKAEAFMSGVIVGGIGGAGTSIALVSSAGSVAGLSAAGITSGLATIGSIAGGGMVAGLAISASVPVITAAGVGYIAYKGWEWMHSSKK